jgi:hypothetical protein
VRTVEVGDQQDSVGKRPTVGEFRLRYFRCNDSTKRLVGTLGRHCVPSDHRCVIGSVRQSWVRSQRRVFLSTAHTPLRRLMPLRQLDLHWCRRGFWFLHNHAKKRKSHCLRIGHPHWHARHHMRETHKVRTSLTAVASMPRFRPPPALGFFFSPRISLSSATPGQLRALSDVASVG